MNFTFSTYINNFRLIRFDIDDNGNINIANNDLSVLADTLPIESFFELINSRFTVTENGKTQYALVQYKFPVIEANEDETGYIGNGGFIRGDDNDDDEISSLKNIFK